MSSSKIQGKNRKSTVVKQTEVKYTARRIACEDRSGRGKTKETERNRSGMSGENSASRQEKRKSLAACASWASEAKSGKSRNRWHRKKNVKDQNKSER